MVQWVKDLVLFLQQLRSLLWLRLLLWRRFDPWPGNFHMLQAWSKKKKKRSGTLEMGRPGFESWGCCRVTWELGRETSSF